MAIATRLETMYPETLRILGLGPFRAAIGREPADFAPVMKCLDAIEKERYGAGTLNRLQKKYRSITAIRLETMFPEAPRVLVLGKYRSAMKREPSDSFSKKRRLSVALAVGVPSQMRRLRQPQEAPPSAPPAETARTKACHSDGETDRQVKRLRSEYERLEHQINELQENNTALRHRISEYEKLCGMLV